MSRDSDGDGGLRAQRAASPLYVDDLAAIAGDLAQLGQPDVVAAALTCLARRWARPMPNVAGVVCDLLAAFQRHPKGGPPTS